jgi:hypothetical protein
MMKIFTVKQFKLGFSILLLVGIMSNPATGYTGWMDFAQDALKQVMHPATESEAKSTSSGTSALSKLSQGEMVKGLKEALLVGFKKAITLLGQKGGFINDPKVKIPMPGVMAHAETALRKAGQGKIADHFIQTMNSAAEKAVPVTADIFANAIRNMTIDDAKAILQGPNDAATQFFKRTSAEHLSKAIRPIVAKSTQAVGLTSAYKSITDIADKKMGFLSIFIGQDSLDLDGYVTQKGLDGLFIKLAEEEAKIRANPMARGTDLLKKVFGAISM